MPLRQARAHISSLRGDLPYFFKEQYIADLASLCALFPDEVKVKTAQKSVLLRTILWRATAQTIVGFYFNNIRRNMMMPATQRDQISSGTSSNEVINAELNNWMNYRREIFQSTLFLGADVFQLYKMITHHSAEYSPTDKRFVQSEVAAHIAGHWKFTDAEWNGIGSAMLNLTDLRKKHTVLLKARQLTLKRPAKSITKIIKRHSFNKKRV